jgi:DNA-binding CsgD family transcriptional regulator
MDGLKPEALSSVIADIYDCVLQPNWTAVLTRINGYMGGAYTTISMSSLSFEMPRMAAHSPWDPLQLQVLNDEFGVDGVPGLREVATGDVDTPRSTLNEIPESEFQATRFYREWVAPQGLRDGCVMKFAQTSDRIGMLATVTRADREIINADERQFLALLSPHLRRAALISDLLDHQRVQTDLYRVMFDKLTVPVLLVGADGRLIHANAAADAILQRRAYVQVVNGQLTTASGPFASALADAVTRASLSAGNLGARGIGIPLSEPGEPPAVAYVLPLVKTEVSSVFASAAAAVFIATSIASLPPQQDVLATLFDLTPAEARVLVFIATGHTTDEISDKLAVSPNTIKTHIARLFSKTGVSRQADLVGLVAGLSSAVVT